MKGCGRMMRLTRCARHHSAVAQATGLGIRRLTWQPGILKRGVFGGGGPGRRTLKRVDVCLLLQHLLQRCSRGGRGIVEDMCYERRRAEACATD
jgi:hypothetical protein